MKLTELTTPFERRRVIEYGADSNKVVRHWYDVQRITNSLYKGRNTDDGYGSQECKLFVFFPNVDSGLLLQTLWSPERFTVEQLDAEVVNLMLDSTEHMISGLDARMEKNQFIGNAQIEFVRQFDSVAADRYAKYRLDYYARKEEEERKAALAQQEWEAAEEAKRQAELEAEKAQYLGWADKMTALRFGKVKAQMEKKARFDGKVMSYREFVIQKVKDGWMPQKKEGVTTWYGSRWEKKESKPKTVYTLSKENLCYTISKTEFDFAEFLVSKTDS